MSALKSPESSKVSEAKDVGVLDFFWNSSVHDLGALKKNQDLAMLEMKQKHCLRSTEHHKDSVENEIANHKTWQRTITTCLKNENLRFPSKIATMLTIKHGNDCVNVYFITINAIETFPVTTWHDHHDKAFQRGMVTCSLSLKHTGEVLPRKINTTALSYYIKLFAVTKRNSCKFFKPLKKWSTGDHAIGCLWTVGRVISKSTRCTYN